MTTGVFPELTATVCTLTPCTGSPASSTTRPETSARGVISS